MSQCADLYFHFSMLLGKNPDDPQIRLYDMLHSQTDKELKDCILKNLLNKESNLRVLFATSIIGMGVDVSCDCVVHYGAPKSVEDYVQQLGRAGRNGTQAHS